jgi:dTDP-4-amino-4,6-dideoxygalactose transaminase
MPVLPHYATNNGHMFYLVTRSLGQRDGLIRKLKENSILAVFHYLSLHNSPFYRDRHDGRILTQSDHYSDTLFRLPLFYELEFEDVSFITKCLINE